MMYAKITERLRNARVAKLADAPALGSGGHHAELEALKKAFFVLYGNYVVIELGLEP